MSGLFPTGHHVSITSIDNPLPTHSFTWHSLWNDICYWFRNKDGLFVIEMRIACLSVVGDGNPLLYSLYRDMEGSWRYQWSRLTQSRSRTTTVTKAGWRVEFVSSLVNLVLAWFFLTLNFDGRWLRFKMSDREIHQGKRLNFTEEEMLTGGERRKASLFGWNEAA